MGDEGCGASDGWVGGLGAAEGIVCWSGVEVATGLGTGVGRIAVATLFVSSRNFR